ncbi:MAG TPA: NAD(P)-binding protein, partial [Gemmatimonadales bacterium]
MHQPYDVIIIGSGFGGAFAAAGLVDRGLRVLMLERGRR